MFVKVHEQIFNSSIMEENLEVRYIWFCLLTLADREGFVDMTTAAIARRINIDEVVVVDAINKFLQPDPTSRTVLFEGKRLEKIRESFGWKIINYIHYRDLRSEENRREYMRNYMHNLRDVNKKANTNVNSKQVVAVLAHTDTDLDTDTDTDTEKTTPLNPPSKTQQNQGFQGIEKIKESHKSVSLGNQLTTQSLIVFEELWKRYPSRVGKKEALKHYKCSVKTEKDCLDIQQALNNYKLSERVKKGIIQNGSTWFNNWRDWIDYQEPKQEKAIKLKCGLCTHEFGERETRYDFEGKKICGKCDMQKTREKLGKIGSFSCKKNRPGW